jgi:cardiolipin synthase
MWYIFMEYWPHLLAIISVVMGAAAAIHATMTKVEVRSALGWVGVILLSPIIGALVYLIAGINLVRRNVIIQQRERSHLAFFDHSISFIADAEQVVERFGQRFLALKTLGDRVTGHHMTIGNDIVAQSDGDHAYEAMLAAIEGAERSILLESYIFDNDEMGQRFVDHLSAAHKRGVKIRVLIDAVGARYSHPSILSALKREGITSDVFNGNVIIGLRLPYANLRTHRKILIVDGYTAFTGGMNIRSGFSNALSGAQAAKDAHFKVVGPIVADLFAIAAEDWHFTTGERLEGPAWHCDIDHIDPANGVFARVVASGPDANVEKNHRVLTGAFSIARKSILIMSPYFLPDRELISALNTAALRGVDVNIIVPGENNLKIVDRAMTAQFDQLLKGYCRIWRSNGPFNHAKLMVIDGCWSYIGSSNMDPRSLRLNFEVDVEVLDEAFASEISARIVEAMSNARQVKLNQLRARPFFVRLTDRILWLASPYL